MIIAVAISVAASPVLGINARTAHAETDRREIQARESFASGRYQDDLDLFVKLYAETVHPNYLRNIGRCYQNLGEPDKAIGSFREYLRQAKAIGPDERHQVEGYIKEMEDLKRQRATEAAAAGVPAPAAVAAPAGASSGASSPPAATPPGTSLAAVNPGPLSAGAPSLTQTAQPAPSQQADDQPIYKRWWFWAVVGGAVIGGVAIAGAAGVFTKTQDATCVGCP